MKRLILLAALIFACGTSFAQTTFRINPDAAGQTSSQVVLAPTFTNAHTLAAGVSETDTIPSLVRWVIFSANCDFFAKIGATAAVPVGDVTDGTASMMNPTAWYVEGSTQVSVVSAGACVVTFSYYK